MNNFIYVSQAQRGDTIHLAWMNEWMVPYKLFTLDNDIEENCETKEIYNNISTYIHTYIHP